MHESKVFLPLHMLFFVVFFSSYFEGLEVILDLEPPIHCKKATVSSKELCLLIHQTFEQIIPLHSSNID